MMQIVLGVGPAFIDRMVVHKVFDASRKYAQDAKTCDPALTEREEFQAGRNVWAAFGLQLMLLDQHADCNSAVLGYSLMYPYTDNWLDLPSVTADEKKRFQRVFRKWLAGQPCDADEKPRTELDQKIFVQVQNVEKRWPRSEHPNVFWSLVAINDAQTHSLAQHLDAAKAQYGSILDITCDKGGTSVLADLFVSAGNLPSRRHVAYSFFFGVGLQIVDDLQDVKDDAADGQQTLFTVPYLVAGDHIDFGMRRLCNFLARVLRPDERKGEADRTLKEGMQAMCFAMALKALVRAQYLFTPAFIKEAERFGPLPLPAMAKLAGMKALLRLVKADHI